ncbi:MAG: large conductance mechanosensitive channel protein MscL [Thermoplasmatota archaeon]
MADAPAAAPEKKMNVFQEFKAFLDEYGVIGVAIAFVIGVALSALVQAVVKDLLMPIVTPLIPGGDWKSAEWSIWKFQHIAWGDLLSQLLNFVIIALFVFLVAKYVLRHEKVTKL